MNPLRLAIVGVGALGRHHARIAASLPGVAAAGVFDLDAGRSRDVAAEFGMPAFATLADAVDGCDAAVVATPTVAHRDVALAFLSRGRAVLVEKPIAASLPEADEMIAAARDHGVPLHVGHVEHHNPAVAAVRAAVRAPRFIETHRLGAFSPRSLDVDVVLDLMIHDLQITQALVGRPVAEVRAAGVAVLSPRVDIANARIAFEGGCVANLTASRVSAEKVRKYRVFAPALYASIDMAAQEVSAYRLETGAGRPAIVPAAIAFEKEVPMRLELSAFAAAARGEASAGVDGAAARSALALALEIRDAIERHQRDVA